MKQVEASELLSGNYIIMESRQLVQRNLRGCRMVRAPARKAFRKYRVADMTYDPDGERVPLKKGRLASQAEFAEMMCRNIRIKKLPSSSEPAR